MSFYSHKQSIYRCIGSIFRIEFDIARLEPNKTEMFGSRMMNKKIKDVVDGLTVDC